MSNDEIENQDQDAGMDDWGAAMAEQAQAEVGAASSQSIDLDELRDEGVALDNPSMDVILDIPVKLSMEVGRSDISIRNLLQLNQGSVVELDRVAGEPLDVLVNGTLVAHGEVVVVNDRYGIRLTDVISPQERIDKLR
ncbi:flagellar motor switch protein FliN [Amphritea japonica]|uniref:Flagellar motor switch protein FliN n=2 Tax=Amphritea TaxID=515417 RepID=A0A7R6P987_9GAMM|nr:flagellar motor switch protein FliN [Amphritea japonica]BBB25178.1 flagellar motor switch protein FliN/FliY [Amphritea japonica ATCC BAA-1530]